jgi:hypothetical protein
VRDADSPPPSGATLVPLVAACLVATIAFSVYARTLLPGVDLGDTGGFQAAVLWPEASARRAYPLYFGLATPFTQFLSSANPARGLNLFSALWAAVATGLLAGFVARLTGFTLGGIAAGLLLAFSYTFWTQAVIAEVYSLHLALILCCLLALLAWSKRPTTARLAVFFAVFALGFGNHLSMILLFVPSVVFLFQVHPRPRALLSPRVVALAIGIAAIGAMQYAQNFWYVWNSIEAPGEWSDRVAAFWMDVTKSDWRGEMVLGVHPSQLWDRAQMWLWDARQQFGAIGLLIAVGGGFRVWAVSRAWAVFVWLAYACSTLFALTYNVGDTHVFLLPGHLFTALAAGIALTPPRGLSSHPNSSLRSRHALLLATAAAAVMYAGWRAWETWPAVDRHSDHRADAFLARLTQDIDETRALLVSKMDWQLENSLLYSSRWERPGLAWVYLSEVLPHFPFLVRDNLREDRDVVLTAQAAAEVRSSYGDVFGMVQDQPDGSSLAALAERIPRGAPYVLTWLVPAPTEGTRAHAEINAGLGVLAKGSAPARAAVGYEVWAGIAGEVPAYHRSSSRPFIETVNVAGEMFTVRMDAWLPQDTFRRGGFGHVLHGREHALWIERGVSLMWLSRTGDPAQAYAFGLYSPEARFRIQAPSIRVAKKPAVHVQLN